MDVALFLIRLLLASVFVVAGVAKLADRGGSTQAVADFGVPSPLVAPLGLLLPLAELAIAAALLPASTAWWGALGALVLLLLFAAGIGANLARGRTPECHCFGQLRSEPAGGKTLARNLVLAALAVFVIWGGYGGAGPSAVGWIAELSIFQVAGLISLVAALGLIAAQWLFLLNLLDQNGRILMRLDAMEQGRGATPSPGGGSAQPPVGLPVESAAPDFELRDLRGEATTLTSLRAAGEPVMLLFTDPDCGPCTAMFPEIRRWQKAYEEGLTIALVSRGTVEANRAKSTEHGLRDLLLQDDWEVSGAYGVESTPSAVFIRPDGTIGSPVLEGADSISAFLEYAMRERDLLSMRQDGQEGTSSHPATPGSGAARAASTVPVIGEPAPPFELTDLNGATLALRYFEGEEVVLIFWDPGCGFCREMLPDIRAWEDEPSEEGPKLLVVSTGSEEANEQMSLSSPVVLDERLVVGPAFGAPGAPSAVIIDENGKIASEVAAGAPAVLSVLAQAQSKAGKNGNNTPSTAGSRTRGGNSV